MTGSVKSRVLLIVGGGIAAYKALELVRLLRKRNVGVRAILTRAGAQFVTPLSLAALTEDKVYQDLFSLTDESEMGHIELSRQADLLVVAPATADLVARMAGGLASDLATTALLATDKPVLIAPAMNVRMWTHPATMRNVARLRADGVAVIGPDEGAMACGEYGPGRMAEPSEIAEAILERLCPGNGPLKGRRILVTSGPTHEPIDPVRYLANRSSGKQGHAIAGALAQLGAHVTLVSGPVAEPDPRGVETVHVETAREMAAACDAALPVDAAVCAAAVADWRPDALATSKIKKGADRLPPPLNLVENPDILAGLARRNENRPALVVGFAAETDRVLDHARAKLASKGCDWIVANDVGGGPDGGAMGGASNLVHILTREGTESWPRMDKRAVAERLAGRIADALRS